MASSSPHPNRHPEDDAPSHQPPASSIRAIVHFGTVPSTNDICRALAEDGILGIAVVADEQTRGRGRHGRAWLAPRGAGLLVSVAVPSAVYGGVPARLGICAPLAVAGAIAATSGVGAAIKWPNDVLLGGQKVAGILTEAAQTYAVVGIGVNLTQAQSDLPDDVRAYATSLRLAIGAAPDRYHLLISLLNGLHRWLRAARADYAAVIEARRGLEATTSRTVEATGPAGRVVGVGAGLRDDGALLVHTPDGGMLVLATAEWSIRILEGR